MAKTKALRATARPLSGWRLALVCWVLVAFTLQAYVVQTHIHFAAGDLAKLGDARGENPAGHHDRFPANDDPANCPLCQEMIHSGQFVTPSAQFLLPPSLAVSTVLLVEQALPFIFAPSHSWQGRAPPRA